MREKREEEKGKRGGKGKGRRKKGGAYRGANAPGDCLT